jgi:hypothetical protein
MPGKIDLFIAGAQKSGTTSLKNYLSEHPQIFGHIQTEFTYFLDNDEYAMGYEYVINKYYRFKNRPHGIKLISKSISLYADEVAIQRLYDHNPNCQIVIMLRNPVDRAYSSFNMEVYNGWRFSDFEMAKKSIINPCKELEELNYVIIDLGKYVKHIQKVLKIFPKDQIHIYLFEDFIKNPVLLCRNIFDLLDVDNRFVPNTKIIYNKTFVKKSRNLASLLSKIKHKDNFIKKTTKSLIPYSIFTKLTDKIKDINKSGKVYDPMSAEMRSYLIDYYKPYNEELSKLTGLDLSAWSS